MPVDSSIHVEEVLSNQKNVHVMPISAVDNRIVGQVTLTRDVLDAIEAAGLWSLQPSFDSGSRGDAQIVRWDLVALNLNEPKIERGRYQLIQDGSGTRYAFVENGVIVGWMQNLSHENARLLKSFLEQ